MILISGATGLAGSHIALELLKRNKKIRAIKRKNSSFEGIQKVFSYYSKEQAQELFDRIEWIESDILDLYSLEKAFEGIKQVYHLAAEVNFNPKHLDTLYKINVEGTSNMVNLALKYKIEKFCHLSSVAVFPKKENIIKETYLFTKPKEKPYAYSKYLAESELWRAKEEGLNIVIVNPSIILGPGFWKKGSGKILRETYKKGFFYTSGTTGYIDGLDVAFCSVELMEKNHLGGHFILNSENLSFKEFISHIRFRFKLSSPVGISKFYLKWISRFLSLLAFFQKKENPLSLSIIESLTSENLYCNDKIKKTLNFEFISIKKALDTHIELYKNSKEE